MKIQDWAFNWKLSSKKKILGTHPSLFVNNLLIEQDTTQKHLGLRLDHKLTFQYHVNEKIKKNHGMDRSSLKTTVYFTSNIFTDYLQIVYKTTFGLR